jgi:hypothetical protein
MVATSGVAAVVNYLTTATQNLGADQYEKKRVRIAKAHFSSKMSNLGD